MIVSQNKEKRKTTTVEATRSGAGTTTMEKRTTAATVAMLIPIGIGVVAAGIARHTYKERKTARRTKAEQDWKEWTTQEKASEAAAVAGESQTELETALKSMTDDYQRVGAELSETTTTFTEKVDSLE